MKAIADKRNEGSGRISAVAGTKLVAKSPQVDAVE
jgi:hypothetical protein